MHIIYNPSEAEFREWISASEREAWKHIPAIKSHIAEEVTLDRCVQRLRKRMVQESWEKQQQQIAQAQVESSSMSTNGDKLGRVPSFFTSNSLVNLSGLGVADQPATEDLHEYANQPRTTTPPPTTMVPEVSHNSGWGGLGLKGNRSSGNLKRTSSDASGLFIDEEESSSSRHQDAGEKTSTERRPGSINRHSAKQHSEPVLSFGGNPSAYVKTTSMARFYYRKTGAAMDGEPIQKTSSDSYIDNSLNPTEEDPTHQRRKSKSHADLNTSMNTFMNGMN